MRLPLALTVIILAAGSYWCAREHSALSILRARHLLVVEEAASLGVSADASKPFTPTKVSKRQREREDSARKVKEFADELVAYAKEMEGMERSGSEPDGRVEKRTMDMIESMLSLNADELKNLITELKGRTDISDEMRRNMIGFSAIVLAQEHPEKALAIFTESSDLLEDNPMSQHVLSAALTQWAKDQPLEAVQWIKRNGGNYEELVMDAAKRSVIAGTAKNDFGLAFQLAEDLKLSIGDNSTLVMMLQTAITPERKAELLAAIRKQASSMTDKAEAEKFLKFGTMGLFSQVSGSGFDKAMEWLKTTNLNADETANLTEALSYYQTKADTGKWLDWMSSRSPDGEHTKDTTRDLVRQWTEQDYKAAGEWLAKSPAGPLKETATLSYLETVAPYDPEVAEQWAGTLPADKQDSAMKRIHEALKRNDKAAAEDFAKRHGIGEP